MSQKVAKNAKEAKIIEKKCQKMIKIDEKAWGFSLFSYKCS